VRTYKCNIRRRVVLWLNDTNTLHVFEGYFFLFEIFLTHIYRGNITLSTTIRVFVNRKASVAFNASCLSKLKLCKINMILLQNTNRKCHIAYWVVPFAMPWMIFDIRLLQCLQVEFVKDLCKISHGFNWHGASRGPSATAGFLDLHVNTRTYVYFSHQLICGLTNVWYHLDV